MTSIESLPPPVIRRLIDALVAVSPRSALPKYATVSRQWQAAIERHTFRELYLSFARLDHLAQIVTKSKQKHLQIVTLHVALSSYARRQRNDKESAADGDNTTRVFTSAIQDLCGTFAQWNAQDGPPEGIHLELLVESPSDETAGTHYSRSSKGPTTTRRARSSVVRLDIPSHALPESPLVSALTCSGRHIELSTVLFIISHLPKLRLLDTEIEHDTTGERDLEQRREFVLGLGHYAPNVTDLRLRRPMNSYGSSREPSKEARSLFHSLLLQYTQRCVFLTFDDCVDARELLEPFSEEDASSDSYWWPQLRKLHLRNSYMLRRPYKRVTNRMSAIQQVHQVILLMGRALRFMPSITNVRVRQYVLSESHLEQIILQYDADETSAKLSVEGVEPMHSSVEAWKASVWAMRGLELEVRVHLASNSSRENESAARGL